MIRSPQTAQFFSGSSGAERGAHLGQGQCGCAPLPRESNRSSSDPATDRARDPVELVCPIAVNFHF
jgi:hypothetical protein